MSKQIQAYFQTEDQAESAKTTLFTYKTENLEVSKLADAIGRNSNILLPLVAMSPSGNLNNAGAVGGMGAGGVTSNNIIPIIENNDHEPEMPLESNVNKRGTMLDASDVTADDYEDLNYVLVAKVEDQYYDEIVQKLREHHAYVEKMD